MTKGLPFDGTEDYVECKPEHRYKKYLLCDGGNLKIDLSKITVDRYNPHDCILLIEIEVR